jgi:hypothetical protein
MDQIPDLCDGAAYQRRLCSKFAALRQHGKFPNLKQLMPGLVPAGEQESIAAKVRRVPT